MIDEKELFDKFDNLNNDKTHYQTNDDICTPMDCVKTMINYIPNDFWNNKNIKVLDPCCGNGNFGAYLQYKTIIDNIYFNDINEQRLENCKKILNPKHISNYDFFTIYDKYDLIIANPPYSGGGNKNKSLSNRFIEHSIDLLKDKGYLCFITPNNWMSYNNNNTTLKKLLNNGSFVVIDNDAKKYFPKVGSSFTIFVWQKSVFNNKTKVINNYLIKDIQYVNIDKNIHFIPLYLSQQILDIIQKTTMENTNNFNYRCDLHNFTKKNLLNDNKNDVFKYKTIHTPKKTRYATIKQDIYDKWVVIIPLSCYFIPYVEHNVNTTQSVGYFAFDTQEQAMLFKEKLKENWIKVLIHLTRYGNFNNILVLKHINFLLNQNCFSEQENKIIQQIISKIRY